MSRELRELSRAYDVELVDIKGILSWMRANLESHKNYRGEINVDSLAADARANCAIFDVNEDIFQALAEYLGD